ncbi:phospholipid/cholesterol/gamma-HCH transport system substrate-binding protein [Silvibacterium bohemicum]|uniref:Phospholipid/cholesterol/gamma-HCH transport system substrate-binding protein n=1 Tax=Silvibacterium bohemicum TaxID=1577686 RepID=A0A841JR59_9BACT|nr:MlaD family protein [Silvibacterium bohemicum]MBB6143882.1 phospholipid/cholesterol/gamma-HCH transport system substrate-binding protein [Silvibacterium bohemicum]
MWNRNITIGIFVVAGTALFTLAIFLIGNQHTAFARHIELYTEFANVDGLAKGSKVSVAGFDSGEVTDIAVPNSPSSRFRLKLRIEQRVRGLVRTDSMVTIATEGVVGDKFLLIHQGSATAPEAAPSSTLPSTEPIDMADLLEKSTGLLNSASGTMKTVADKLNGTLDAVTTTVDNANDLVVGLKQGKGTIGMLLRDETTATNVRQAVVNAKQATTSLNHASGQADALVSDLQSRGLGQRADQTMSNVQSAARNLDATSQQLHQTLTTALGPDEQGVDAAGNIQESLSNLNQATGNMAEDTEALKHEFFFRGFFKHRGYYSLATLDPTTYRTDKLFTNTGNPRAGSRRRNSSSERRMEAKFYLRRERHRSIERSPSLAMRRSKALW